MFKSSKSRQAHEGSFDGRLDQFSNLLQRQQVQMESMKRQHAELLERIDALQVCLEASGIVRAEAFQAQLHRRRFLQVLNQHPCACGTSIEAIGQTREMTLNVAKFSGVECAAVLAASSRTLNRGVREVMERLLDFYTPTIYVFGGEGSDEDLTSSVERLNPSKGDWEPVAPMLSPRAYCAAAALGGRVYVIGGSDANGGMLNTMDRFDPALNLWEEMPHMQVARAAVAATTVDSQLCAIGGNNDLMVHDSVETFDPEAKRWHTMLPMQSPRWAAGAAAIGRQLYVIGGRDAKDEVLSAVERYDQAVGRWCSLPPLRTPRASFAAAAVGGKLYVVGGYDTTLQDLRSLESFDPKMYTWQQLKPMMVPRFALGAVACSGSLYVLGGAVGDVDRVVLGNGECYDPKSSTWTSVGDLRMPRRRFGVAACCRGLWHGPSHAGFELHSLSTAASSNFGQALGD
mmetsp:Transcript_13166/g.24291  ORF Transcript_13166/g.24291 Transcript_13166/m.24291 type:complete len:458 (+) Transcript_13166:143-1516(+)